MSASTRCAYCGGTFKKGEHRDFCPHAKVVQPSPTLTSEGRVLPGEEATAAQWRRWAEWTVGRPPSLTREQARTLLAMVVEPPDIYFVHADALAALRRIAEEGT